MAFDSVQVRFKDTGFFPSPFANTRVVPFVKSYFEILKSVVGEIKTEYFWFFSSFINITNKGLASFYQPSEFIQTAQKPSG